MRTSRQVVRDLTQKLRAMQQRHAGHHDRPRPEPTPLAMGIANTIPRISFGAVHEWIAGGDFPQPTAGLFLHLARLGVRQTGGAALWIGSTIWPYPHAMAADGLLQRSVLIDCPDDQRVWAIDLALRQRHVAVVLADGSGLDMAATRRLQLAAEAGGSMALLARPLHERGQLSAAATRWLVEPTASPTHRPRWRVELLRDKTGSNGTQTQWTLEWNGEQGTVTLPADLVGGPGEAIAAPPSPSSDGQRKTA